MTAGQLLIEHESAAERALERGAALLSLVSEAQPLALYGTALTGEDTLVLGRYQLASQALPAHGLQPRLRRSSGGSTVRVGAGISYVALALHERSSLMTCPPGRLLNRNVRGVLQGLRALGAQANYFGRDFLSFGAPPAVFVAWDFDSKQRVLLEFFISQTRACFVPESELAYPARREPALRGQTPVTLADAGVSAHPGAVFEAIAQAHAKHFGVTFQAADTAVLSPTVDLGSSSDTPEDRILHWSLPREEAIGFVSAGVSLDGAGKFAAVRVAGDFLAHRSCAVTLERVLRGVTPNPEMVARAVDAAFAQPGHDLEGIRSLRTFQDAIIDAAGIAQGSGAAT